MEALLVAIGKCGARKEVLRQCLQDGDGELMRELMRKYASDMLSLAVEENLLTKLLELAGGPYPLHWAANKGHISVIEALMNGGADVMAVDSRGRIPLMEAASAGHEECVKSLLTKTPELQVKALDRDGANALFRSILMNNLGCVRMLLEHSLSEQMNVIYLCGRSLLQFALTHQDIFEELLKHEWPHDILDKTLQLACLYVRTDEGFRKNVLLLLGRGALLPAKGQTERDRSVVRTALRELALSATLPDRLNEAVVGVALHKRQRIA
jgi:ankyrin repeat protein